MPAIAAGPPTALTAPHRRGQRWCPVRRDETGHRMVYQGQPVTVSHIVHQLARLTEATAMTPRLTKLQCMNGSPCRCTSLPRGAGSYVVTSLAAVVVTMACGDACPLLPGKRYEDWELDDPSGKRIEEIRPIRDQVTDLLQRLIAQ